MVKKKNYVMKGMKNYTKKKKNRAKKKNFAMDEKDFFMLKEDFMITEEENLKEETDYMKSSYELVNSVEDIFYNARGPRAVASNGLFMTWADGEDVRIVDLESFVPENPPILKGNDGPITALALSPNNDLVYAAGQKNICAWELHSKTLRWSKIKAYPLSSTSLCWMLLLLLPGRGSIWKQPLTVGVSEPRVY
ncbi:hypothetical protein P3S67_000294 [Capsicum chacoense]